MSGEVKIPTLAAKPPQLSIGFRYAARMGHPLLPLAEYRSIW